MATLFTILFGSLTIIAIVKGFQQDAQINKKLEITGVYYAPDKNYFKPATLFAFITIICFFLATK